MIEAELRHLLRKHRPLRFPTAAWLARNAPAGLAAAIKRTGGGAHWARVLNMPPPQPARWTDELLEAELRRVCAGSTCWPTRAEFASARATGAERAVYAGHGSRWSANRLGLSAKHLRTRRGHGTSSASPAGLEAADGFAGSTWHRSPSDEQPATSTELRQQGAGAGSCD